MHVVLVDPSRAVRSAVANLLAPAHVVSKFSNPCEALDHIRADAAIDAVITAAELMPISGQELCWELRLLAAQRPIYVLLMSSNLDERDAIEALDSGADDLINKPPKRQELYAKLRAGERMLTAQRRLIELANTDSLTSLLNRRAFFERASESCTKPGRVAAILLDIDHFKEINDLYGHYTGDEALRAVAREISSEQSIVGRLGGDELCILLSDCSLARAWDVAEQLRGRIANLRIKTPSGTTSLTCSLGVSELGPNEDVDDLIRSADLALYRAKLEGRDCAATPPPSDWLEQNPRHTSSLVRLVSRTAAARP